MCKRILLTGATGYLGSRLAMGLLAAGYDVVVLKRRSSDLRRIGASISKMILLDVDDIDWRVPFNNYGRIEAVVHVAANYGRNGESAAQIAEANLDFPLRLMDAACEAGVGVFMNTDTALEKFLNPYSLSKRQFAEWGKYFSMHRGIRFINLKLEHFFGAGDDKTKFTSYVIQNCLDSAPELKLTLGEQERDFIYIEDVVAAYLSVLEKHECLTDSFVELDVGSGEAVTIRHFVELVHRLTASHTRLNFGAYPYRQGEPMFSQADTRPLQKLGWRCRHTLEQGLRLAIEGYKQ